MARLPASFTARLGRGARSGWNAIRPGVPFALGTGALALGAGFVVREATAFRAESNPPLQTVGLDTDPASPGAETWIAFDRKTGRQLVFGEPASSEVGPERSQERQIKLGILVAGAAAFALVLVFGRRD